MLSKYDKQLFSAEVSCNVINDIIHNIELTLFCDEMKWNDK